MRLVIFPIPNHVFLLLYAPVSIRYQVGGSLTFSQAVGEYNFLLISLLTPSLLYWMTIFLKWSSFLYFLPSREESNFVLQQDTFDRPVCLLLKHLPQRPDFKRLKTHSVAGKSDISALPPVFCRHLKIFIFCCLLSLLFSIIHWYCVVVKVKSSTHQTE